MAIVSYADDSLVLCTDSVMLGERKRIHLLIRNLTTGDSGEADSEINGRQRRATISSVSQLIQDPGCYLVTVSERMGGKPLERYAFYKGDRYIVQIQREQQKDYVLLRITSPLRLPVGRIFLKADGMPFQFFFPEIAANQPACFAIAAKPRVSFCTQQLKLPEGFITDQPQEQLDFRIRIQEDLK